MAMGIDYLDFSNQTHTFVFVLFNIILLAIGIIMFKYILYKQATGEWQGLPSLKHAILFTIIVFGSSALAYMYSDRLIIFILKLLKIW